MARCSGCQLLLDGTAIIDVFEPLLTNLPLKKPSPCIALPASPSPRELLVTFALDHAALSSASSPRALVLTYAACDPATGATTGPELALSSASNIYNPFVWAPGASVAGPGTAPAYIGGLQCDVYRSAAGTSTLSFAAQVTRVISAP
jgi:hypothetical protein